MKKLKERFKIGDKLYFAAIVDNQLCTQEVIVVGYGVEDETNKIFPVLSDNSGDTYILEQKENGELNITSESFEKDVVVSQYDFDVLNVTKKFKLDSLPYDEEDKPQLKDNSELVFDEEPDCNDNYCEEDNDDFNPIKTLEKLFESYKKIHQINLDN